jgi:hypothetical protein
MCPRCHLILLLALSALCASVGGCSAPVRTATHGGSNDADAPDGLDRSDESHASHTHTHDVSHESDASQTHEPGTEVDASDIPEGSSEVDPGAALRVVRLTDSESWRAYPAALDPLADHQPAMINCPEVAWFPEGSALDVETAFCNYLLVEQPSKASVPAGSEVELELRYFDLKAPEPASAHVAFLFDRDVQWELTVPIPNDGLEKRWRFRTARDLAAGEPIRLHLHNHGTNTWLFGQVLARP